ncbi:hypothetical protein P4131_31665 [Pseudomonas aeruginosa]|nr:hypothetical protein [Pseudomonas aeruginosa]
MTENEAQVRSWQSCVIDDIIQQTPSIKSFFLRLSKPFAHTAGQHVDIRLTAPDGYSAMRSYSIASSAVSDPDRRDSYRAHAGCRSFAVFSRHRGDW